MAMELLGQDSSLSFLAKIVAAEGEKNAAVALKEASDTISDGGCALQLRYLQTLNQIAAEKNSTIVFPLPLELLGKGFFGDRG